MTLWILGAGGQVGRAIVREATIQGLPVQAFDRQTVDICNSTALASAIGQSGIIINAAAYTAVDRAESEPDLAMAINGVALKSIANLAAMRGMPLIHISTDYVFNGNKTSPYDEDDETDPVSVYGRTKEVGEQAVRAACPQHIILRTAWVYDSIGANFVRTMLRFAKERSELRIVADQWGGPTSADDIAEAILIIAKKITQPRFADWGIYHFIGAPPTTWYDFASAILADKSVKLQAITTAEYPTSAKRPANSILNCNKIKRVFGIVQPNWQLSLGKVLRQIKTES